MAASTLDLSLISLRTDGGHVIDMGEMDIWDGSDLALLRETLKYVYTDLESRRIGIDMSHVKYVPSGFFGMLFDYHDQGVVLQIYSPQPQVLNMLWFQQFFSLLSDGVYQFVQ